MMESIGKECSEFKQEYDACFNKWYAEKFLKGEVDTATETVPCAELFNTYKECVVVSFRKIQVLLFQPAVVDVSLAFLCSIGLDLMCVESVVLAQSRKTMGYSKQTTENLWLDQVGKHA